MEPRKPTGNFGLGLNYSKQGRYEDAITQFKAAIRLDDKFYDAYAEMGYALADLGQIDDAMEIVSDLEEVAPELADTLSSYVYQVDPPKMVFAYATSSFNYWMPIKTPVSSLDTYLQTAERFENLHDEISIRQANGAFRGGKRHELADWPIFGHRPRHRL